MAPITHSGEKKKSHFVSESSGFLVCDPQKPEGLSRTQSCSNHRGCPGSFLSRAQAPLLAFWALSCREECAEPCPAWCLAPRAAPHHMLSGLLVHDAQEQGWGQLSTCLIFALWNYSLKWGLFALQSTVSEFFRNVICEY